MSIKINLLSRNKPSLLLLIFALIMAGAGASAANALNTAAGGYLVCVDAQTKLITHPGTKRCPKGTKRLVLGAQGLTGAAGLAGTNGKTLWSGDQDPDSSLGSPGDMFINSVTKTLFGPKDLTTNWPVGVSLIGPRGATGPTGAQGPGGATGAAGATGATGAAGAAGGAGGNLYQKTHSDEALNDTVKNVITLTLPAGSYLVTYTGMAYTNSAGGKYVASNISIAVPGNLGGEYAIMVDSSINDGRAFVTRQLGITLADPGSVSLFANTLSSTAILTIGTLTAVQVAAVNNQ
jgi:hypothetical protein